MFRAFPLAAALIAAHAGAAQQPPYESAFTGYQPYREEPVADWRTVNDEVARIGGHAGIVRGAAGHAGHGGANAVSAPPPQSGRSPQRTPPAAPAPHDHRGAP